MLNLILSSRYWPILLGKKVHRSHTWDRRSIYIYFFSPPKDKRRTGGNKTTKRFWFVARRAINSDSIPSMAEWLGRDHCWPASWVASFHRIVGGLDRVLAWTMMIPPRLFLRSPDSLPVQHQHPLCDTRRPCFHCACLLLHPRFSSTISLFSRTFSSSTSPRPIATRHPRPHRGGFRKIAPRIAQFPSSSNSRIIGPDRITRWFTRSLTKLSLPFTRSLIVDKTAG